MKEGFQDYEDPIELSEMLEKDSYTLTPTDLFVIYNEFNINFILITNKYSDKFQEITINNGKQSNKND